MHMRQGLVLCMIRERQVLNIESARLAVYIAAASYIIILYCLV